jgi:hypothetical protein
MSHVRGRDGDNRVVRDGKLTELPRAFPPLCCPMIPARSRIMIRTSVYAARVPLTAQQQVGQARAAVHLHSHTAWVRPQCRDDSLHRAT